MLGPLLGISHGLLSRDHVREDAAGVCKRDLVQLGARKKFSFNFPTAHWLHVVFCIDQINICWGKLQKVFMAIFIPPNILLHCGVYMILEMNLSKNLLLKTMN